MKRCKSGLLILMSIVSLFLSCKQQVLEPEGVDSVQPRLKAAVAEAAGLPTIVFASYNVRVDVTADAPAHKWSDRKTMIANLIKTHKFDIFGVQEAKDNQMADLQSLLPDFNHLGSGREANGTGEHTAIFYNKSKFSILASGNFWLSETPTVKGSIGWDAVHPRVCTWAKIRDIASNTSFFYFNTHLDLTTLSQTNGVKLVLAKIKEISGTNPVVLSGDFNSNQTTNQYNILQTSGVVKDAYTLNHYPYNPKGHTYNGWDINRVANSRIDHIFVSSHFQVDQFNIIIDTYNNSLPSDHYPVRVRLNPASQPDQPGTVSIPVGRTISIKGSNGKYVTSNNGTANMRCDRTTAGSWERFEVISAGTGKVYLKSMGKYVSSENGAKPMICNRATASTWEAFDWIPNADGTFSLRGANGRYVRSGGGTDDMTCTAPEVRSWEKYTYQ
ncbi:endonuclease/exonuclease/phosphatase family protein [Sphingobacterium sp. N143]|uniref:endonuclease/exonuclease/phosphatase family protein n=1 Tax=Sphingobacterium sp. N143 TaxID=2746727 RepID=UPI002574D5F6|nr:endonuclease/exonuclease/phosphatase family protein [Sphingobacterium sp. N143]MDM1296697.1 endonuclease/exonuclease/phosphatase family protein [Sphingobacterium sp. N143]